MTHNKHDNISILCVHQGNELYGSDIMFVQSIKALRQFFPKACIDVIIPGKGPIEPLLSKHADHIIYGSIWVFRKSHIKTLSGMMDLFTLPGHIIQALKMMKKYHIVYINTVVVLNFIIAALFSKTICLTHVHEIIPGIPGKLLGFFIRKVSSTIICNSYATCKAFGLKKEPDTHVIWNGTSCPAHAEPPAIETDRPLRILMPGRINSWKGQNLLVQAIGGLKKTTINDIQIRIVGDVFKGQDHFRINLINQIKSLDLDSCIELLGFSREMDELYKWADVVIVPSLKPEPFGLVAIEAMSHARPVIGASHGGLKEILADKESGWLFPPGDALAITQIIISLLDNKKQISQKGIHARQRALKTFSNATYRKNIQTLFNSVLEKI